MVEQIKRHLDHHFKHPDLNGKKVLLKVNLLSGRDPDDAVTTHPEFLRGAIEVLHDLGASCIIGDSPGGPFTRGSLRSAYEISGFSKVAKETGAELNYDVSSSDLPIPDGRFIKRIPVANYVRNADVVIALPKLKTHMLTGITCATKIMFGAVPGVEKVKLHGRFQSPLSFSKMLLDLTEFVRPDLFLLDGIIGMEGEGPAKGRPRKVGIILSGNDHIEMDMHVCEVVGLDPGSIPIFSAYSERQRAKPPMPVVAGEGVGFKLDPPFVTARGWSVVREPPKFLANAARSMLSGRPVISKDKCRGCMFCAQNCSANAIMNKDGIAFIDRSRCIRCYCCHELCPHGAVEIKDPPRVANWILDWFFGRIGK